MEKLSSCAMRAKEIVNISDGSSLGTPADFEFDVRDGKICSIIIYRREGIFFRSEEMTIPWSKIQCIGEDKILVNLSYEEQRLYENADKKKKSGRNL